MYFFKIKSLSRSLSASVAVTALTASILGVMPNAAHAQILRFNTTFSGTAPTANANQFVNDSLSFLGNYFKSPNASNFTLNVSVTWGALGGNVLGSAGSGNYLFGTGGTTNSTYLYGQPLYRYLQNDTNLANYTQPDIKINLSNQASWDYTMATPTDPNKFSLASVLYHEDFHALGFLSDFASDGNYDIKSVDINGNPIGTGFPAIFSSFVENTAGQKLVNLSALQRQAALTGGTTLYFNAPNAVAANGGQRVQLYAPSTFQTGSSGGSHTDQNQSYAPLMRPAIFNGQYNLPSNVELAMMQDLGYQLNPSIAATPEASSLWLFVGGSMVGVVVLRRQARRRNA